MEQTLYLDNDEHLCFAGQPIRYDLQRRAKIDLCLELVHEFLKRRKKTTNRLELVLHSNDKKLKEQIYKKHELLCGEEPLSLFDGIKNFYNGLDSLLDNFSELLTKHPNYPREAFRIREAFYSELKGLESTEEVINEIFFHPIGEDESMQLVHDEKLRELIWEIYRDGSRLKVMIENIRKRRRKILNAKVFDIFTREQIV